MFVQPSTLCLCCLGMMRRRIITPRLAWLAATTTTTTTTTAVTAMFHTPSSSLAFLTRSQPACYSYLRRTLTLHAPLCRRPWIPSVGSATVATSKQTSKAMSNRSSLSTSANTNSCSNNNSSSRSGSTSFTGEANDERMNKETMKKSEKDELVDELVDKMVKPYDSEEWEENTIIDARVRQWLDEIIIGLNLCPFAEPAVRGVIHVVPEEQEQQQSGKDNDDDDEQQQEGHQAVPSPLPPRPNKCTKPDSKATTTTTTTTNTVAKPLLHIQIVRGTDEDFWLRWIGHELLHRKDNPGTTLVVCPECHANDFNAYMDFVNLIDGALIPEFELEGLVQVAPFHPLFRFDTSETKTNDDDDDDDNDFIDDEKDGDTGRIDDWTNRSPYPIFHILREDDVEKASNALDGDSGRVWTRNVNLLHAICDEFGGRQGLYRLYGMSPPSSSSNPPTGEEIMTAFTNDERHRLKQLVQKFRIQMGSSTTRKSTSNTNEEG